MTRCSLIVPLLHDSDADLSLLQALEALDDATIGEIILIRDGNGPGDDAPKALAAHATAEATPIRYFWRPSHAGFAAACNAGAILAAHPLVLFLAPHVRPHSGWLSPLIARLDASPRAAAAGSKLLSSPDTVHHAGIAVDQEGWPRRIYEGFPAGHAAVNRTRRMQMVSPSSMLVRRAAFDEANGFDAAYAAEDTGFDLCLRLGERGHEVHYCHDSVATCSPAGPHRDESPAMLARSRRLFRTRWIHKLRPDDVRYYLEDRLLQFRYADAAPVSVIVAPPLAVAPLGSPIPADSRMPADDACSAERVLAARGHQVQSLLQENARLMERVAGLEAVSRTHAQGSSVATLPEPGASSPDDADDELMPSASLALSVGGAFRETGEEFLAYFVDIGGLRPHERVLEVGCGVGRMAVPLTRYLTGDGRYDGFDVMADAIAWCQTHVTPRFPAFTFQHAALRNRAYNPSATTPAAAYTFPYPDASFDFVFLTSVFTHLLPDEVRHYLAEIARVLKPGGRCFSTFFLLNPESEGLMQAGLSPHFPFAHRHDGYRVQDADVPEAAVAYDETRMRRWHEASGLVILDPVRYGFWCGRLDGLSLQDIVLAIKA